MIRWIQLLAAVALCTVAAAPLSARTPDLPSCDEWRLACSSNYQSSSRPGSYPIYYVVIHKVEGSAAGAASWFQNCSSGVSAHYEFDNNSGYCYQSVYEKDIAYHAGNWTYNTEAIGIEHGGYTASNDVANACYRESGLETRSCVIYYGVAFDRSHIIGHYQVPGCPSGNGGGAGCHTDPGIYWNWDYYMSCSNPNTTGDIRNHWLDLGGEPGVLGNPTTAETGCPDGVGRFNHFDAHGAGGSIYWTPSLGAHEVHGAIHAKWQALGWETGVCGYPITDESTCPDGVGRYNHFDKGSSIYWTPGTGAHQVGGAIRNTWANMGWENSSLGYPTSDEYAVTGGRRSDFQHGTLTWNASTGVVTQP
jgi:uncharacterized protein with LGFP repeats